MHQRLRFCLVTTFYPPYNFGGDGIYAHRLANALAAQDHRVTVLHSPSAYEMAAGTPADQAYDDHPNVTVKPIRTPLGKLGLLAVHQTGRPCFQGRELKEHLDRGEFDVIHYNNVSMLGGPHVFRYGSGLKLCTLIEHWLVCPMHVLWRMDREVCTRPTCLRCTLHGRRPPQLWRYTGLLRRASRSIDAFIGPSMFTMNKHRERGLRGTMIQLPLFHRQGEAGPADASEVNGGRPYFLFVGRLEKIKGVQSIIPTFRELDGVDLVIAGTGTFERELRAMADGTDNIRFVGRADHRRLASLYRGALATIVPSLCYETFGIIVAESFAAGTPVIVRGHSSLREIVERYGGGFTFETGDELRAAIERVRTDRPLGEQLGREGSATFENEFGEAPFLRGYLGVVEGMLALKREGRVLDDDASAASEPCIGGRPVLFA